MLFTQSLIVHFCQRAFVASGEALRLRVNFIHFCWVSAPSAFVTQNKTSKTRTPPSQTSKSTPKAQKISPSKGNSRSPHTPSPSKTGLAQGSGAKTRDGGTPSRRGSGQTARRELGLSSSASAPEQSSPSPTGEGASLLWVDKYRPCSLKAVIGQQGDQSCANKLLRWLQAWHKNHSGGARKPAGSRRPNAFYFAQFQPLRILSVLKMACVLFCFLLCSSTVW